MSRWPWINDRERQEREKQEAQRQAREQQRKDQESLRQRPGAVLLAGFWAKLVPAIEEQCGELEELERRFPENRTPTCKFAKESDSSFRVSSNASRNYLSASLHAAPHDDFIYVDVPDHYAVWGHDLRELCRTGAISPENLAAEFVQWVLDSNRQSDLLRLLPWRPKPPPPPLNLQFG